MTGSEMAAHLEKVAEGARNGNSACTELAREMLAARRMLEALEMVSPALGAAYAQAHDEWQHRDKSSARNHEKVEACRAAVRAAIADAKGEPR